MTGKNAAARAARQKKNPAGVSARAGFGQRAKSW